MIDQSIVTAVSDTLDGYFGVKLSDEVVSSVLISSPALMDEIEEFGIHDTTTREMMIDSVASFLGITDAWPTYGTDKQKANKFFSEFAVKITAIGGKFDQ